MATFVVPINDYANGSALSTGDWANPITRSGTTLTVSGTAPNKTLVLFANVAGTKVFSYTPVNGVNNIEGLVKFRLSSDFGKEGILALRYSGSSEATTAGYIVSGSVISSAGQLAIDEGQTGYLYWSAWNYLANTTYWVRFQVNGTTQRAKVWTDGSSEPAGWTVSGTDSHQTSGSFSGLTSYSINNTSSATITYYYVSFGTNGDSAPSAQTTKTIQGNFRVEKTADKTQQGNFRVQLTTAQTQQGDFRVTATTTRTQTGNFDVQKTTTQTQQGNFRIAISNTKTQTGDFRVQQTVSQAQSGNFSVRRTTSQTQDGNFRVAVQYTKTQVGNFAVANAVTRTQQGNFRVQRTATKTTTGDFNVIKQFVYDQIGNFNVRQTLDQLIIGNFVIAREYLRTQQGNFRVVKGRSYEDTPRILSAPKVILGGIAAQKAESVSIKATSQASVRVRVSAKPNISISSTRPIVR